MAVPYEQMAQEIQQTEAMAPDFMPEYEEQKEIEEDEGPRSSLLDYLDQGNLVDELDNLETRTTNAGITSEILELYEEAKSSMDVWRNKYKRAINLAKLQAMSGDTEINEKSFPFEGASLVMLPYILEAMLDFSSRAAGELVWSDTIVKAKVYGTKTKEKEDRAKRVADYSNYQLSELIPDWRSDQDKGLMILAGPGTFYKETYYDSDIREICSELCLADDIIFNHNYKSFKIAPDKFRKCNYTRNDVISFIRGSQKWLIEEEELNKDEENFDFIKAYTWIDLDNDGLKEPYMATIWEEKNRIVCLYPCFDEDTIHYNDEEEVVKIEAVERFTQYRFLPDPEGGPMGLGWGILLGPMFDAINTNVRQLIDAGTLSLTSANSGLISQSLTTGKGNSNQSGSITIAMGELTPVPSHGSGSLKDNVMQLPFAGPSPTIFQLLEYLVASSRTMTNSALNVESQPGEAASLYLARLQQGLKVPNSIIMRVYDCAKREFQLIAKLNYKHFDSDKYNKVLDSDIAHSMENDFNPDDCDIRMVADPSLGSDIERIQRAQVIYEMAKDPQQPGQVIDYRKAVLGVLDAMNTPDVESLAPEPDPNAKDPQAEMQQALIMQQMADMENNKRSNDLRAQENEMKGMRLKLEQQKLAMQAAKDMAQLGLADDEKEAKITLMYTQSLKNIVDMGFDAKDAMGFTQRIENTFIDANKDQSRQPTEFEYDPFIGALNPKADKSAPSQGEMT